MLSAYLCLDLSKSPSRYIALPFTVHLLGVLITFRSHKVFCAVLRIHESRMETLDLNPDLMTGAQLASSV